MQPLTFRSVRLATKAWEGRKRAAAPMPAVATSGATIYEARNQAGTGPKTRSALPAIPSNAERPGAAALFRPHGWTVENAPYRR